MTPHDLSLEFHMVHDLQGEFRNVMAHWLVDIVHSVEDVSAPYGLREDVVGRIDIVDITLGRADTYEALDSLSIDLTRVADALIEAGTGELNEDVEDLLEPIGSHLLVLNEVRLDAAWRGRGIGALVAGEALIALSRGAQLATTIPGSLPDLPDAGDAAGAQAVGGPRRSVEDEQAITSKLERVWAQIGFEPFRDGVWIVDLAMSHLDDGVAALREKHGLDR